MRLENAQEHHSDKDAEPAADLDLRAWTSKGIMFFERKHCSYTFFVRLLWNLVRG